ncbi:MAG TPA: hypothetical protein VHL57_05685, partial [Flavobacteriales bacterium]|nr:hypothetical protein [Flavobacteriales bacterium]
MIRALRTHLALVALACATSQGLAQFSLDNDASADSLLQLDFAVPDMPAFKSLGVDPSDILRPSELKDLALLVAPGLSSNLALEWSPGRIR